MVISTKIVSTSFNPDLHKSGLNFNTPFDKHQERIKQRKHAAILSCLNGLNMCECARGSAVNQLMFIFVDFFSFPLLPTSRKTKLKAEIGTEFTTVNKFSSNSAEFFKRVFVFAPQPTYSDAVKRKFLLIQPNPW